MRVMVFAKASAESEQGVAPTPEMIAAFARWNASRRNSSRLAYSWPPRA